MPPSELLPAVEQISYQNMTITYQKLIDAIENLPIEEQESLFELIHKRRIEKRRVKIVTNGHYRLSPTQYNDRVGGL